MILIVILLIGGLWLWPGGLAAIPSSPSGPAPTFGMAGEGLTWPIYRVPDRLTLCGEAVPLEDALVREDLDREFTIVVWSRAQTTMWLKRGHRYLPEVEKKLQARRLPADLKYVVVVESDLRPKARSNSGALGPWQFMAPTAQRFQLKSNDIFDERLDFGAATDAALNYLTQLYQIFHDWPLALAAYNCGEGRVQKEIATQGVKNYFHLSLPEETERYVHRILAAKIILEDPGRYGYDIPAEQLYPPLEYDEVTFVAGREVTVKGMAAACGSYYKYIKALNPWIKGAALPPGTYRLKIPKGTTARFQEAYRTNSAGGAGGS